MNPEAELREGMAVFDASGQRVGEVEDLRDGHFFLTHVPLLPVVKERIVVDVGASVSSVDADGVHLQHDRQQLLARQARPRQAQSSRQLAPGEDPSSVPGDEDSRPLDADDFSEHHKGAGGPRTG